MKFWWPSFCHILRCSSDDLMCRASVPSSFIITIIFLEYYSRVVSLVLLLRRSGDDLSIAITLF